MTPKKTRPVKAKKMPEELRELLQGTMEGRMDFGFMAPKDARAILAALAHEREAGRSEGIAEARAVESER